MKTDIFVLFLIVFSSSIFSQSALTFRYPEGDSSGADVPRKKDGHRFLSGRESSYHPGVDFNIGGTSHNDDEGQPVMAIASGEVVEAYFNPLRWGNIVLIKHALPAPDTGFIFSFYAHLKSMYVSAGSIVNGGDTIGTVGCGPKRMYSAHLHFEIRKGNMAKKPASFYPAGKSVAWVKAHYYNPRVFLQNPLLAIRDTSTSTTKKVRRHKSRSAAVNIQLAKVQEPIPDTVARSFKAESEFSFKEESAVADRTNVGKKVFNIDLFIQYLKEREAYWSNAIVFNRAVREFFAARAILPDCGPTYCFKQYKFDPADRYAVVIRPASRYF